MQPTFYLTFAGEIKFQPQVDYLFEHFELLEHHQTKDFEKFLLSPFFVSDEKLLEVFRAFYTSYLSDAAYARGIALMKKLYGRYDLKKDGSKLKKHIKQLSACIRTFKAHSYLQDHPQELAYFQTKAIQHHGQKNIYQDTLQKWKSTLSDIPMGIELALHDWLRSHANYFADEVDKFADVVEKFRTVRQRFRALAEVVEMMYQSEALVRKGIFKEDGTTERPSVSISSPLIIFYQRFIELRKEASFNKENYHSLKTHFQLHGPSFSPLQHYFTWQLLTNYINYHLRSANPEIRNELLHLLHYQIEHDLLRFFAVLPKSVFLNCIITALINGDQQLHRLIVKKYGPRLSVRTRDSALAHAEIALSFYAKKYQSVLLLLDEAFPKHHMDVYIDALRLKTFRLRSILMLLPKNRDFALFDDAKKDFDTYLRRRGKYIIKPHLIFYQNFSKVIQMIFVAVENNELAKQREEILAFIDEHPSMHCRDWLIDYVKNN